MSAVSRIVSTFEIGGDGFFRKTVIGYILVSFSSKFVVGPVKKFEGPKGGNKEGDASVDVEEADFGGDVLGDNEDVSFWVK